MLLTVDIGTSTFKAALWDSDVCKSITSCSLSIDVSNGVVHEADPSQWLFAFEKCCKELGNLQGVKAVIISGNGPSLVPVTGDPSVENGLRVPSENARLWLDRRALNYQADVTRLMGGFVDASFFLPKILFIKNEEIELYKKVKFFLGCPEYLAYALTGEGRTVFPCEGFDRWFWNDTVLEKLELKKEKFPKFIKPGDQFGEMTAETARYLGFNKNIPVISGGPDFFAAILGSGVIKPGQALDRTGSSEGINLCTKARVNDERLMSYAHPVNPYWNLSGIINTTGKAVEWGCDLFAVTFNDFIKTAKESKSGSGGLIFNPYLAGERAPLWDPSARAVWHGISLSAGKAEFFNSILEGISFAVKDVITVMKECGEETEQLRVTGGLSGCEYLNQIKADITGLEVIQGMHKEAELMGLAVIGNYFLKYYNSYAEASSEIVKIKRIYEPNRANSGMYNEMFEKYRKVSGTL